MPDAVPRCDQYGFLVNPDDWDREVAAVLARRVGVAPLNDGHYAVVDALRRHYQRYRAIPPASHVCLEVELEDSCIQHLFQGPLNAWLVAGLPNPGEEARVYLDNQTEP